MYIMLDKITENEDIVIYQFCMKAWEYDTADNNSNKKAILNKKIGVGSLNKQTGDLIIDWDKTDKYYLDKSRELFHIKWRLMDCKKLQVFPDILDIATG